MKNNQKGFIIPLVITIIALLAIGAGAYVHFRNNSPTTSSMNLSENATSTVQTSVPSIPVSVASVNQSDNEAIIQGVLNMKEILSSGDASKIRAYLLIENADNPTFTAQIKSTNDTALLSLATLSVKPLSVFTATFMRTQCKITITGNVAKVSFTLASSGPAQNGYGTESVTVKKINGIWQ
jgi:hypothetical protein